MRMQGGVWLGGRLVRGFFVCGNAVSKCVIVSYLASFEQNSMRSWLVTRPPFKGGASPERFLKRNEISTLKLELSKSNNKVFPHIVQLLILTGCRRGEALNAKSSTLTSGVETR